MGIPGVSSNTRYIKHKRQCFIGISKHQEESWKYDEQQSIFDEIQGVWIADETLSQVFDNLGVHGEIKSSKSMLIKKGFPNLL